MRRPVSSARALEALNRKYAPDYYEEGQEEIRKDWDNVQIVEIRIDHMTGKEALKAVREIE